MKHRTKRSMLAGVMSLAMLAQAIPAVQLSCSLTAQAAVSTDSIQTRVFEYDFGGFKALYDIRTARWFDEKGKTLVRDLSKEQSVSVPEGVFGENVRALVMNPSDNSYSVEMNDGSVTYPEGILAEETEEELTALLTEIHTVQPEYRKTYYDRAQQKNIDVPVPAVFPLIYRFSAAGLEDSHIALTCRIYFGTILYGTVTAKNGQTSFTRASDADDGTANPFTSAGDVTVDGVQDVSDAVLTSRLLAEDKNTPVTSLGWDLADKNEDGMLTGRDITELLFDIVHKPADKRGPASPAGTLPVIGLEQIGGAMDDALAQMFGYQTVSALGNAIRTDDGAAFRTFMHCRRDGQNDVWDILYYDKGGCIWQQFNVKSLTLESDGTLTVAADIYEDKDSGKSGIPWVHLQLTVLHNDLPANLRTSWNLTEVRESAAEPQTVSCMAVEKLPEHAVPVQRLVQSSDDEDAMAKAVGFADAAALRKEIKQKNVNQHAYQKCVQGSEYDTWNLVYIIEGGDTWQTDTVRSMQLMPNGRLDLEMETVGSGKSGEASREFSWVQLTVPHGTLPLNRSTKYGELAVGWQFTHADAPSGAKPVRYLVTNDLPENAIPLLQVQTTPVKVKDMTEVYAKYGIDYSDTAWSMGERYDGQIPLLKTESKAEEGYTYDRYSTLILFDAAWGGFSQMELEAMSLNARHELNIVTQYTFDKYHYTPGSSDNYYIEEVSFSVPHGSLPDDLQIAWEAAQRNNCRQFELPEVQYITREFQDVNPENDMIVADVQIDSDHTGAIIPAEFREKLEAGPVKFAWNWTEIDGCESGSFDLDPGAAYAWRCYREPEDTDEADIQLLLSQGNDVIALYYVRDVADQSVYPLTSILLAGEMKFTLEGDYNSEAEKEQTYYRVLLITPDGVLPEVESFVPEFQIREESPQYYEANPVDESAMRRYVTIHLKDTDGIAARVLTENGGEQSGIPEDVVSELADLPEGSYVFRQYTAPEDTDNVTVQNQLRKGKDVLALYTVSSDSAIGMVGGALESGDVLNLTVMRQSAGTTEPVSGIHCILLATADGALPALQNVNVRDAGAYRQTEFAESTVSVFRIQDFRENYIRTAVRADAVSAFPAEADLFFNESEASDFTELVTDPSATNDADIRDLLAAGNEAVIAIYIRDTDATHRYGVTELEEYGYLMAYKDIQIGYDYYEPENAEPAACAGHRILLIPEAGKDALRFYISFTTNPGYGYQGQYGEAAFESQIHDTVYIPSCVTETVEMVSNEIEIITAEENVSAPQDYFMDGAGVDFYTTEEEKNQLKEAFGIEADWSNKDVARINVTSRLEDFRCGITQVFIDEYGILRVMLAEYTSEPKDHYYRTEDPDYYNRTVYNTVFLLVTGKGVLSPVSAASVHEKMFHGSQIMQFESAISAEPGFESALQQAEAICCRTPGSCVRHTTDLLTDLNGRLLNDGEAVYSLLSAEAAQSEEFLTVENAAEQLSFRSETAPDLSGADMLLVGFGMSGNVTKCDFDYGCIDENGVLHLNVLVFRDTTKPELEDTNAACLLGIAADRDSFTGITGVVLDEIREFEGNPQEPGSSSALNPFGSAYNEYEAWAETGCAHVAISRYDTARTNA